MKPESAIQRVSHAITTPMELTPLNLQLQERLPSVTAEPTGAALPTNM